MPPWWDIPARMAVAGAGVGIPAFAAVMLAAMPAMQDDLGISKADLGLFLTLHGLLYGVSRFVNGMWADDDQ